MPNVDKGYDNPPEAKPKSEVPKKETGIQPKEAKKISGIQGMLIKQNDALAKETVKKEFTKEIQNKDKPTSKNQLVKGRSYL